MSCSNGQGKILDSAELRLLFGEVCVAAIALCLASAYLLAVECLSAGTPDYTDIKGEALTFQSTTKASSFVLDIQPDWLFWGCFHIS